MQNTLLIITQVAGIFLLLSTMVLLFFRRIYLDATNCTPCAGALRHPAPKIVSLPKRRFPMPSLRHSRLRIKRLLIVAAILSFPAAAATLGGTITYKNPGMIKELPLEQATVTV